MRRDLLQRIDGTELGMLWGRWREEESTAGQCEEPKRGLGPEGRLTRSLVLGLGRGAGVSPAVRGTRWPRSREENKLESTSTSVPACLPSTAFNPAAF